MESRFRLRLFLVMIIFAIAISVTIGLLDYFGFKKEAIEDHELAIEHVIEKVESELETIERTYYVFDQEVSIKMKTFTRHLLDKYEEDPLFDEWDFQSLKETLEMDLYIINKENVITHSNLEADIGLDFKACCKTLSLILDERRELGKFFIDGMDIEQSTGEIKRYSYMATSDKEYIIELGYSLERELIFEEFNYATKINKILDRYTFVNDINILNLSGIALGQSAIEGKLSKKEEKAFNHTLDTKEMIEIQSDSEDDLVTHRYVSYDSVYDLGTTKQRVLEIIYNEEELQATLNNHKKVATYKVLFILSILVIGAYIIAKLLENPMYLAFHDSLTGLKNRASFDSGLKTHLEKNKGVIALLMMDLDKFKTVNDRLGHDEGDRLLQLVAKLIQSVTVRKSEVFRIGGDEFSMIIPSTSKVKAKAQAEAIIEGLNDMMIEYSEYAGVTISIGIAFAPEDGTNSEELYKKADSALYVSKNSGRNQCQIYVDDVVDNI